MLIIPEKDGNTKCLAMFCRLLNIYYFLSCIFMFCSNPLVINAAVLAVGQSDMTEGPNNNFHVQKNQVFRKAELCSGVLFLNNITHTNHSVSKYSKETFSEVSSTNFLSLSLSLSLSLTHTHTHTHTQHSIIIIIIKWERCSWGMS